MSEPVIFVDGVRYVPEHPVADRVLIHGMYDMHLFHLIEGATVDEVIKNWLRHNAVKQPAIVGDREVDDMGESMLCPAIVMRGDTKLRRVGQMVFTERSSGKQRSKPDPAKLEAYRAALKADPDITRLLAKRAATSTTTGTR